MELLHGLDSWVLWQANGSSSDIFCLPMGNVCYGSMAHKYRLRQSLYYEDRASIMRFKEIICLIVNYLYFIELITFNDFQVVSCSHA